MKRSPSNEYRIPETGYRNGKEAKSGVFRFSGLTVSGIRSSVLGLRFSRSSRLRSSVFGLTATVMLACVLAAPGNLPAQQVKVEKPDPAVVAADAERAKLLAEVPKSTADYTLQADQAQIGWEGMTTFAVTKDYFAPGANSLHLAQPEFGKPVYAYWKLKGIRPGKYYLGLWAQTNDQNYRTEYSPNNLLHTCFINGWATRFSTTSDPVQVKPAVRLSELQVTPAVWLTELQGKEAVELKDGDEIALAPAWGNNQFLRLCLYAKEPARGHGVTGQTWGISQGMAQQVQLATKLEILGKSVEGQDMEARVTIGNPLPYAAQFDADVCLADYFGKPLKKETLALKVESHKVYVISYKFKSTGADRAYQLDLKTHASKDTAQPVRPIEMVEQSDFARLAYLPSRPGPLEVWNHERFDVFEIHTGHRKALPLDGGDWQIAPLTTKRVPAAVPEKLDYKPTYVPYHNSAKLDDGVYGQWFRKTFKVPAWMRGERYVLDFTKIVVEGTLFVNGKRIAAHREGSALPLVVDVTDSLKLDGDNEVVLCVRDAIGVVSEEFVDQFNGKTTEADCDANADFLSCTRLFVNLESVYLRTAPAVRVNQIVVLPKPDQGKLKVLARVENTTKEAKDVELGLNVQQFGKEVETALPETKVHLNAGQIKEVPLECAVKGLVEYTPRNPALARLEVFILGNAAADAAKPAHAKMTAMTDLDNFVQRFGYRQLRVQGTQFTWNGHPKRMLGSFQHWPVAMYERQEGIEASRDYEITGPWIPLDVYDEIGKMTYPYLDGTGSVGWKWLNNDRVQQSGRRIAVEYAWLTGYHPSVIGYDMANESFHYDPYSCGVEGQAKHGDLLARIAKTVHEKVDPDLWIFTDGDESLGGRINFCSFHYLNQGIQGNWGRCDGNGINDPFHGCFHYSPDCFYINGSAQEPKLGTVLHQNPDWKYGSCACGETETFWFFDGQDGIYPSSYLGDKCAVSSNYQFYTGRGMNWCKMSLDAYRDMDMALTFGIYWRPFLATGVQHVTFIMPQQEVRYYSGAKFDRRLDVVDDEFQPGMLTFTWQLLDENGRRVDGKQLGGISTTKFLDRDHVKFDIPRVSKRTQFTLSMSLTKDGILRAGEERLVEVWPAVTSVKTQPPAATTAVFDPKHGIDFALRQLGCPFKTLETLAPKTLAEYNSLIVGPMAIDDTMSAQGQAVRNFAGAGGRVILLEQASMLALPADTYVEHQGTFSQAFVTKSAAGHPVMAGLTDADFQMWNFTGPNGNAIRSHLVSERIYRRPARGNFMTLVECGHGGGLQWTPLMEVYIGKGSILATQFPLTSRWQTEPMAAEMLTRMIAYLDKPVYRSPQAGLAILGGASEAVKNRLTEIRTSLKDKAEQGDVALLDMTVVREQNKPLAAQYAQWVRDGGSLIVHRTKPQDTEALSMLVGKPVKITVEPYQAWEDRQMLDQPDSPLLAGLNNVDFYWRSHIVSEAPEGTEQISNGVPSKHRFGTEYVVYVEGAKDLLFPGGLVEVQVGKGRVIIDQLNWEMSDTDIIGGSPQRVISMLLTNLGVVQRPPNPKPVLPANVTYETVDISKEANTSMVDDKAGGVNDWCSWGPDADIRDMPSGKVTFTGTPFDVPKGKFNAICLRTNWIEYLKKFPDSVTVPVGKSNVAGIWLLHSGGWSGGKASFGRREIWYSDGAKEVIDMNGDDMGDWNYGHDQFPDEEYTTTTVAWKGSCKQYNVTRVYKTLWVNPHPDKTIDKIVITNAGLEPDQWRFTPHLAVTLAMVSKGGGIAAGDAAKAKALIAEATKLLDAKDTQGATAKLDAALAADPSNAGAWELLTSLRSKTDDPRTFTDLCQKWMAADPKNPKPYNILAAYLENKGQKEEALKLYKQSLQIEWNQPPAGEAVRRLESELKK